MHTPVAVKAVTVTRVLCHLKLSRDMLRSLKTNPVPPRSLEDAINSMRGPISAEEPLNIERAT